MSSFMAKPGLVPQAWYVIDATDQVVGRLAVQIANIIRGKHRPQFTPHQDTGEFVVVINAEKIKFTGNKWASQTYSTYSGYAGGLRTVTAADLRERHPERILEFAVKRMVPRGPLGRKQLLKLKVYAGSNHPHQAQQPKELKFS
ncbi:MAG: 50S ribosomal protein L13 [Gemmataceae bacterium]|nr:50S ribosomal protein L13 [Gemmataceae bacterium]